MRILMATALALVALSGCGSSDSSRDSTRPDAPHPTTSVADPTQGWSVLQVRRVIPADPEADPATCQDLPGTPPARPKAETWVCFSQLGPGNGPDVTEVLHLAPAEIVGGVESAEARQAGLDWVVFIQFDDDAAEAFSVISRELHATQGRVALLLKGEVLTAPAMVSPDLSDQVQISVPSRTDAEWLARALSSPGS